MKELKLDGNYVQKVQSILLNDIGAKSVNTMSNFIDTSIFIYEINGTQIKVQLDEEMINDYTTISCEDQKLLMDLSIKLNRE